MTYTYDENLISDLHKECYGFRPSSIFWSEWAAGSPEYKQATWDYLVKGSQEQVELEEQAEKRAVLAFEEKVAQLQKLGATNRAMAVRWLAESVDCVNEDGSIDAGYFCYNMGLPYDMQKEFQSI